MPYTGSVIDISHFTERHGTFVYSLPFFSDKGHLAPAVPALLPAEGAASLQPVQEGLLLLPAAVRGCRGELTGVDLTSSSAQFLAGRSGTGRYLAGNPQVLGL